MLRQAWRSGRGWRTVGRRVVLFGVVGLLLSLVTAGVGFYLSHRQFVLPQHYWDHERLMRWSKFRGIAYTRTTVYRSGSRTLLLGGDSAERQLLLDDMQRLFPPGKIGGYAAQVGQELKGSSLDVLEVGSPFRLARGMVKFGVDEAYSTQMFEIRVGPGGAGRVYMIPNRLIALGLLADVAFWACAAWVGWWGVRVIRARSRQSRENCQRCGYDIRERPVCPECGTLAPRARSALSPVEGGATSTKRH